MRYLLLLLALMPLQSNAEDAQIDDAYSPYRGEIFNQYEQQQPQEEEIQIFSTDEPLDLVEQTAPISEAEPLEQPSIETKKAVLQVLDKINASVSEMEVAMDVEVVDGALKIELKRCLRTPNQSKEENLAFLRIWEVGDDESDYSKMIFSGWMFSSNPALHSLEHPIYDVVLLKCGD